MRLRSDVILGSLGVLGAGSVQGRYRVDRVGKRVGRVGTKTATDPVFWALLPRKCQNRVGRVGSEPASSGLDPMGVKREEGSADKVRFTSTLPTLPTLYPVESGRG
jgi:hypothetical protein